MRKRLEISWVLGFFLALVPACQPQAATTLPVAEFAGSHTPGPLETPLSSPTAAAVDSPTPTVTPVPLALLLAPPEGSEVLARQIETALSDPLAQSGLALQVVPNLTIGTLDQNVRLVIGLPPDVGMQALAAAAPQVQFLAVGVPGLTPGANLSLIGPQGFVEDQRGFIAGVIAAMITPDWRVAALSIMDTPAGRAASRGFWNGATYFCGLCNPYYGPIVDYPLYAELPAAASLEAWQAEVDFLKGEAVKTVYIFPGIQRLEVYELLAQAGFTLIGSGEPPLEGLRWAASVDAVPESAVLEALPDLLAGNGGAVYPMPLVIQSVNESLFGVGKQQRAREMLEDLMDGFIDTRIDPLTGESR